MPVNGAKIISKQIKTTQNRRYMATEDRVGMKKRIAANIFLTAILFLLASKSRLMPSGVPNFILEGLQELMGMVRSVNAELDVKPSKFYQANALPPSSVYNTLHNNVGSGEGQGKLIILIVMESFGWQSSKATNAFILKNIESAIYHTSSAAHGYSSLKLENDYSLGGTLAAELRYLCNLRSEKSFDTYKYWSQGGSIAAQCIPKLIVSNGGTSWYIHDGGKRFYRRNIIMPLIGFTDLNFQSFGSPFETLSRCFSLPFCGSDKNSYDKALNIIFHHGNLPATSDLFIHIMTIDSHSPYTGQYSVELAYKEQVSSAAELLSGFLNAVMNLRQSEPTVILIAPDHPAPLPNVNPFKSSYSLSSEKGDNFVYVISN